jgi:hypothetical protein
MSNGPPSALAEWGKKNNLTAAKLPAKWYTDRSLKLIAIVLNVDTTTALNIRLQHHRRALKNKATAPPAALASLTG